mgnify:FL=1
MAIYRRDNVKDGRRQGFEVIHVGKVPKGTVFAKGAAPTTEDKENYPGAEAFGFKAWHFHNEKAAWARFDELVMGKA